MNTNRRSFILSLLSGLLAGCVVRPRVADSNQALIPTARPPTRPLPPEILHVATLTPSLAIARDRWRMIVGHHSGVRSGNAAIYDRAHKQRGMENGLAYHFVIGNGTKSKDGEIEVGGRWLHQLPGGHVRDERINQIGIGICLVGNFEITQPTPAQLRSFVALMDYLRAEVTHDQARFAVHREIDPGHTVCPGRNFPIAAMHQRYGF